MRAAPPSAPPSAFSAALVHSPGDARFETFVDLASRQGLDRQWCLDQLAQDAAACIVQVASSGEPAAMGMVISHPYYVAEIDYTFDPGASGCYFYSDHVHPSFRGQRLKRLLDACRAAHAASQGANIAYSIADRSNIPSIRAHLAGHFRVVARVLDIHWNRWRIALLRRTSTRLPGGRFVHHFAHDGASDNQRHHLLRTCDLFASDVLCLGR